MKLHRFTASDTTAAMMKVRNELGLNAIIFSTRRVSNGIEILAGLPQSYPTLSETDNFDVESDANSMNRDVLEQLTMQLKEVENHMQKLTTRISHLEELVNNKLRKKKPFLRNLLTFISRKKRLIEGEYEQQTI